VWPRSGKAEVWASGQDLQPTAPGGFGVNGLKVHDGSGWVSNSSQGTLLRIPVLFCASAIDNLVYVGMHRLFGQVPPMPFVQSLSYKLIATTVAGTILLYLYDAYFSGKARQRRQFTVRRRVARRPSAAARRR